MRKTTYGRASAFVSLVAIAAILGAVFLDADEGFAETSVSGSVPTDTSGAPVSPLPDISVYFQTMGRPGITTAVREISAQRFANFDLGSPAYIYRLTTTAEVSGRITVYASFDTERFVVSPYNVRLAQIDGDALTIISHTSGVSFSCGATSYLSSFAAAQNFGVSPIVFSRSSAANGAIQASGAISGDVLYAPHGARISFLSAPGEAALSIANGPVPATGARVLLNGRIVGTGSLFKKHQNNLSSAVLLLPGENTLEVSVDGGPGSSFTLSITRAR